MRELEFKVYSNVAPMEINADRYLCFNVNFIIGKSKKILFVFLELTSRRMVIVHHRCITVFYYGLYLLSDLLLPPYTRFSPIP